jgi:hypothetical protein
MAFYLVGKEGPPDRNLFAGWRQNHPVIDDGWLLGRARRSRCESRRRLLEKPIDVALGDEYVALL